MKRTEFTYPSADGRSLIHGVAWLPDGAPRAVLQIAHGVTEHMGRYETLAAYFTAQGYAVMGNDHLGHGRSQDEAHPLPMYFGPKGTWTYVVADVRRCAQEARTRFPEAPLCLMGFSLGSFAVRCLLGETPDAADMTVWAGTGQMTNAELAIAGLIVKLEERRFGEEKGTPLLHKLTMGAYNQRFKPCRTGADWLCANAVAVDEYLADPLCGEGFTVSSFRELLTGMKTSGADAHVTKMNRALPILLLSGQDDPVGGCGKGVKAVCAQLSRHLFTDVQMQLLPGMRHDIFHETDAPAVFARIEAWMSEHIKRS